MQQQIQQEENNLMDFKVLSRYDDLFTDIFLDNLFLWFNTIKMNHDHRRPRVPDHKILSIIQRNIIEKAKPTDAVNELLAMDYFKHYLAIKKQKEIQEFIQHMKRYLYMYMPNAGYEVGDTKRYSGGINGNGRKIEACLVATKDWHIGDEMRLLTGMIACLDPKDDAELKKGNRDFSVMWSTRKNCSCLFLGPARFANHDCNSNCRFISNGQNSIIFKVVREIKFGEEITVYYGKHYFGENNCECRCITCENQGMGYFATLETKENTPIDNNKEEDQSAAAAGGGTRRSTRKRKPALHEDYSQTNNSTTRRSKRASIEPVKRHSTDSLEELIGAVKKEEDNMEVDSSPLTIKREQELASLPPMPISPTTAATEKMARLKVMSIGFLCGSDEEEQEEVASPRDRRVSDCPLLDLLADAVTDAEYLDEKKTVTVVVNPEIHRDATNRVYIQQQLQQQKILVAQQRQTSPSSPIDSSESKADSAVSLSPRLTMKEEEDRYWRREMDDGLFNHTQQNMNDDEFLDFLDDGSDLSSVNSWSSEEEEEEEEEGDIFTAEEESIKGKKLAGGSKKKATTNTATTTQELVCIACSKPLTKQDITEETMITNGLATWTWSPSAIFTDWKPKRCPRCERHFTIFKQEWPNRKIKKKRTVTKKLKKGAGSKKTPSKQSSPFSTAAAVVVTPIVTTAATTKKEQQSPKLPSTPIYQMQDDTDDLNYIPPSPLSEVQFDDDDDEGPF